ncbi:hypothetical protein HPC62_05220 [Thermoleptolyngbya sichuanensis A183]|uniref:Uncharacterized protein n=1 Tax=Thermoleptolyngbya sichuanensis A183 TaxID=2737172 RepID=A0A6M8BDG9_9CYAN|nr:hypothetical protein HPC62_05220 [Thermoleptolyngbya sichuanensis A183]
MLLIGFLVWLAVFHWQTQRALRWWFEQQHHWLCREAEQVRNGPLQNTFVMRRQLEMNLEMNSERNSEALSNPLTEQPAWMAQVTQLNGQLVGQLVRLSDELSPPYLETSLPLALQAWAQEEGLSGLLLCLPSRWPVEPTLRVSLLLSMLTHLLRGAMSGRDGPAAIALELVERSPLGIGHIGVLTIRLEYPAVAAARAAGRSPQWALLSRAFAVLAPGRCTRRRQAQCIVWQFRWRLSPDLSPSDVEPRLNSDRTQIEPRLNPD